MKAVFVKIILAIILLLCLLKLPYGYYQFVRFVALIGFSFLAIEANDKGPKFEAGIFIALALLFQPFIKIALGRVIWNFVDVVVALSLLVSIFIGSANKSKQ